MQPARNPGGLPTWLIVLLAVAALTFVIGILAAIAIPVFISQHSKAQWQSTTVALPDSFAGVDRGTDKKSLAVAKTFAEGQVTADNVGIYGASGPRVMVIVAIKLPTSMSSVEQAVERKEYEGAFAASGLKLVLNAEDDPGPLGGWLGCGSTSQGVRVCLATDSASMVSMISGPEAGDPVALMRQARAQTVSRQ